MGMQSEFDGKIWKHAKHARQATHMSRMLEPHAAEGCIGKEQRSCAPRLHLDFAWPFSPVIALRRRSDNCAVAMYMSITAL